MIGLQNLTEAYSEFAVLGTGAAIISLVLGVMNCFFGYKMLKFWVTVIGFVLGASLGYYIGNLIGGENGIFSLVGMVILGILLAALAFRIYLLGVFILCGGIACFLFFQIVQPQTTVLYILGIVAAIGIGILATFFVKTVVIVTTAIQGGMSVYTGISFFLWTSQVSETGNGNRWIYIGVILAVCGMIVQFITNKKKK